VTDASVSILANASSHFFQYQFVLRKHFLLKNSD